MDKLYMWTIYDHPLDFPCHFVVRCFSVLPGALVPAPIACLYDSLDAARSDCMRNGADGFFDRDPNDDQFIIETWM